MKRELRFKVFDPAVYDERLEEIKKIPRGTPRGQITKRIAERMDIQLLLSQEFTQDSYGSMTYYRLRPCKPGEQIDETHPKEFSYHPKPKEGRANLEGQSVLYTSLDAHTAIQEKASEINPGETIAYLSKWEVHNLKTPVWMRSFMFGLADTEDENDYAIILAKGLNEFFEKIFKNLPDGLRANFNYGQKLVHDLFSIPVDEEDYYHITSAIAYDTMVEALKQKANLPILCYPSVAKGKRAVNVVFRKDFVDNFMRIKEVDKILIKSNVADGVSYRPLSRGVLTDGKIVWHDFDLQLGKIDFDNAMISSNPNWHGKYSRIGNQKVLTSCCKNHSYSVGEFFEKQKIGPQTLLNALPDLPPHQIPDFTLQHDCKYGLFVNATGVFRSDDITKSGIVNYIAVPISYSVLFRPRV